MHVHDKKHPSMELGPTPASSSSTDTSTSTADLGDECDIGKLLQCDVDLRGLTREHKHRILTSEINRDPTSYPRTRQCASGAYRQFQPAWKQQHPWLHYSRHLDGVFCHACVFFAPEKAGGQALGQFVTKPLKSWASKSQKVDAHAKVDYHMTAMAQMHEFLVRFQNPSEAINVVFNKEAQKRMEDNQKVVEALLKVIILCGRQGLALRGHRDDHIDWSEDQEDHDAQNRGNFIELVRFRAETDGVLHAHLQYAPRNARYTSKTIQNQLIDVVGKRIRSDILSEVKAAKFFSIIADEVTDVGNKEQLSLSLRYVHREQVQEVFIDYVEVERITGKELADTILRSLSAWGLSASDLRGQCYDGSSNMSGARSGCMALVKEKAPLAIYVHCAAHRLNLAIVSACKVQAFQSTESCIGEIARFFRFSAKRQRLLDKAIDLVTPAATSKKLKDACRTRWVQRIDSYIVFLELLPAVHKTFQAIVCPSSSEDLGTDWNWDGESITKANGFLYQLESSTFLITFKILLEILSCLRPLTMKLQMQTLDIIYAHGQVKSITSILEKMREQSEREFKRMFTDAGKLGKDLHGEEFVLTKPRVNRRQMHRSNVQASTAEEYYRITLYNEFLSHTVSQLKGRFLDSSPHGIGLLHLLPSQCCSSENEDEIPQVLSQAVDFYKGDMPHSVMFPTEYHMWVKRWKQDGSEVPKKMVDALQACDGAMFPNIRVLLQLALTLPITSCECERSFRSSRLIFAPQHLLSG